MEFRIGCKGLRDFLGHADKGELQYDSLELTKTSMSSSAASKEVTGLIFAMLCHEKEQVKYSHVTIVIINVIFSRLLLHFCASNLLRRFCLQVIIYSSDVSNVE